MLGWIGTDKQPNYTAIDTPANTAKYIPENAPQIQIVINGEAQKQVKGKCKCNPLPRCASQGKEKGDKCLGVME